MKHVLDASIVQPLSGNVSTQRHGRPQIGHYRALLARLPRSSTLLQQPGRRMSLMQTLTWFIWSFFTTI
jgi:hypothetical protein